MGAKINSFDIVLGDILCDCTAATAVYLAKLSCLPYNAVARKYGAKPTDIFGVRIVCA